MRILLSLRVHTDIDGSVQAILDSLADEADLQDWVVTTLLAHVEESVGSVGGDGLLVDIVGRCLFDLAEEVLLHVELTDVGDCAALNGVIGE